VWSNTVCSDGIPKSIDCRGTLVQGQSLSPGDTLTSPNTTYTLVLQPDGNLVVYAYDDARDRREALWSSWRNWPETDGKKVTSARLQRDGNFVLYNTAGAAVWSVPAKGSGPVTLFMQDLGFMVIDQNGKEQFTTKPEGCTGSLYVC